MANNNKKTVDAPKVKKAASPKEHDTVLAAHKKLRKDGVYTRAQFRRITRKVQSDAK